MARLTGIAFRDWHIDVVELTQLDIEALSENKPITQLQGNVGEKRLLVVEKFGHPVSITSLVNGWEGEE